MNASYREVASPLKQRAEMTAMQVAGVLFLLQIKWVIGSIPNVAIIGGGVGGTSTAYFMKDLKLGVDIYEATDRFGGRLRSKTIGQKNYDVGGSILHPRNKYAHDLTLELGLKVKQASGVKMGIANESGLVFTESDSDIVTAIRFLLRYGLSWLKLEDIIDQMLDDFNWIYLLQNKSKTFQTNEEILNAMNKSFYNLTKLSLGDQLRGLRLSQRFLNELVQSITLVNYGQSIEQLHAFVGYVSGAGAGAKLWSIDGGNELLPQTLVKKSNGKKFLNTKIEKITLTSNGKYILEINGTHSKEYDAVVISVPLPISRIEFINFTESMVESIYQNFSYHRTVATLVAGKLKPFDGTKLESVLFCEPKSKIHSIGKLDQESNVYKIFSEQPLEASEIAEYFDDIEQVDVTDWFAYPNYYSNDREDLVYPKLLLHPGLIYANAIEWSASAIEMSLISGKNSALYMKQFFNASSNL